MISRLVLLTLLVASATSARAEGDPIAGKTIFQRICQNCHSNEIGVNKVGPSLWNVVGRQAGSVPDFQYSEAMKANKSAWTISSLDAYPRGDIHGVKMFFRGLRISLNSERVLAPDEIAVDF